MGKVTPLTEAGCCIESTTEILQAVRESKRRCNTLESVVSAHLEGGGLQLPSLLLGFLRHFFFKQLLEGKKKHTVLEIKVTVFYVRTICHFVLSS